MNKLFTLAIVSVLGAGLMLPHSTFALSVDEQLKKITELTAQIKALQDQMNGLKTQQVALQSTASQTAFEIAAGLKQGTEGDQVKVLQTLLALDASIYPEGKVTGFFGPSTRKALERFQRKNGLSAVGVVGPKTRDLLEGLFRTHFAEAKEVEDEIKDDVEHELDTFLGSLPVVPANDGTCAIPVNPYASTSPFIQKDGKTKIISNGNSLIYKNGKHKIVITPNSYIEKDGKKKLLITPGYRIEKNGKNKSFIRCGNGTTTPPLPGTDTAAPTLSAIQASPSFQTATVSWITNEAANGKVYYGTANPLVLGNAQTVSRANFETGHSFSLTGLSATTTYFYVVESRDASGNTSTSAQQSFVTTSAPDSVAPSISAIGISAGTSTATITWTTNEAAKSKVYFSTTTPLNALLASTNIDAALVTGHTVQLTGLTPSTTYYFKVESADATGNTATSSETIFVTSSLPVADTTGPVLSAIGATPSATSATIVWTSNEAATSKVYYSTTTPLATSTALQVADLNLLTNHSKILSGLIPSTVYFFRVESVDASGNVTVSSETSFTTAAPADTTAPVISATGASNVSSTTATIAWNTNESATSKVYYGTVTPLATSSASVASVAGFATSHSVALASLTASTTYYVVVESKDSANNTATGSEFSFTSTN